MSQEKEEERNLMIMQKFKIYLIMFHRAELLSKEVLVV